MLIRAIEPRLNFDQGIVEGEQKKSTQTFLSLEAISYRPECFKALK